MQLPTVLAEGVALRYAGRVDSKGQKIEHYCGIVLALQENAAVGYRDGTFCIGIFEGLINSVLEVVFWIFRSPLFMPGLGAGSSMQGTQGEFGVVPGRNWVNRKLRDQPLSEPDFYELGCPVRERAAMQMVMEVLSFVVLHEFQHIVQGHVSYFKDTAGMAFISEDGSSTDCTATEESAVPVRTIQRVFEYEADWAAYREMQAVGPLQNAGLSVSRYRSAMKRMRQVAPFLALYIFTFHWAAHATLSPTTHPDPFRRMYALIRRIQTEAGEARADLEHLRRDLAGAARALGQLAMVAIFDEQLNQHVKEITDEEYVLADDALQQARALGFPDGGDAPIAYVATTR